MKKLLSWIIILLVLVNNIPAFSEEGFINYYIPDIGMSVTLPNHMIVVTRDMSFDDSGLDKYGTSQEEFEELINGMAQIDMYFRALGDCFEFAISYSEDKGIKEICDSLTEDNLSSILSIFSKALDKSSSGGAAFAGGEIYHQKQVDFLHVSSISEFDGETVYIENFMTKHNGNKLLITFNIYHSLLETSISEVIEPIMDNVLLDIKTEEIQYFIPELDISVNIPDRFIVCTRALDADETSLLKRGHNKDSIMSFMKENNVYLYAVDKKTDIGLRIGISNNELYINMLKNPSFENLSFLINGLENSIKYKGLTCINPYVFWKGEKAFYHYTMCLPEGDSNKYSDVFITAYGDHILQVNLYSNVIEFDNTWSKYLETIIDSMVFGDPSAIEHKADKESDKQESIEYIDKEYGIRFTVPGNWKQEPMIGEYTTLKAKFKNVSKDGLLIIYSAVDLWDSFNAFEKVIYPRNIIDNTLFSKSDIAEMCSARESDVSTVIYNGKVFYKVKVKTSPQPYNGIYMYLDMIYDVYIQNGIIYMLQFSSTENNEYYSDFEELLSSIEFYKD
ncbi:MAG: hypothetical protein IKI24_00165 [Clostridia bacterium]|nr:hypothetical protein [Clostridia bacterium]